MMNNYRFTESADAKGNPVGTLEKQEAGSGGQQSWVEDMKSHIPYDKEAEKDKEHDIAIAEINSKIPEAASAENKLTDENQVNEDIATASATLRGNYNLVTDLGLTLAATHSDIEAALATTVTTADNNDYCWVDIPTSEQTPTQIAATERYKYVGATSAWVYEFTPTPAFSAAQWAAINSGITQALVESFGGKAEVGTPQDPKTANTVYGAKAYADDKVATESAFQKNLAAVMSLAVDPNAGVTIVTTNPEWKLVYTDAEDKILLGKRQDNTWYFATDLDTILDAIIDGYTTT